MITTIRRWRSPVSFALVTRCFGKASERALNPTMEADELAGLANELLVLFEDTRGMALASQDKYAAGQARPGRPNDASRTFVS
jgi:hypothetical protein